MGAFFMKIKHQIPAILWGILILVIIGIPGNYIPKPHGFLELISPDKIIHLFMFAPFSFLISRGIWKQSQNLKSAIWISFFFGIIYAFSTELLQFFVISGRNGNIYDAIADSLGVLIGLFLFFKIQKTSV